MQEFGDKYWDVAVTYKEYFSTIEGRGYTRAKTQTYIGVRVFLESGQLTIFTKDNDKFITYSAGEWTKIEAIKG